MYYMLYIYILTFFGVLIQCVISLLLVLIYVSVCTCHNIKLLRRNSNKDGDDKRKTTVLSYTVKSSHTYICCFVSRP